jgi:hypothetical protein
MNHISSQDRQLASMGQTKTEMVLARHLAINWHKRNPGRKLPKDPMHWLHACLKNLPHLTQGFTQEEILYLFAALTFKGGVANPQAMNVRDLEPTLQWLSGFSPVKQWREKVTKEYQHLTLMRGVVARDEAEARERLLRPHWGYLEEQILYYIKAWKMRHEGEGWIGTATIEPEWVYLPMSGDKSSPYLFSEFLIDTAKLQDFQMRRVTEEELNFEPKWLLTQPGYEKE